MNPPLDSPPTWSGTRWATTILLVFAAHLGLLLAFSAPDPAPRETPTDIPEFSLLLDRRDNAGWLTATTMQDPTVLALSHPLGFSGEAWNAGGPTQIEPLRWPDDPSFLAPAFETFGQSLSVSTDDRHSHDEFSSQRRVPSILSRTTPRPARQIGTRLLLSGGLQQRGLALAPPPPVLSTSESLPDTIVEVDVDRAGAVYTCRISRTRQSGPDGEARKSAEDQALRHARSLRFRPASRTKGLDRLPDISLTSGTLTYRWAYAPPSAPEANR